MRKTVGSTSHYLGRAGAGVTAPVVNDSANIGSPTNTVPGLMSQTGSVIHSFAGDQLGTRNHEIDGSGAVATDREYDAFGNLLNPPLQGDSSYSYAGDWGYLEDSETGLKQVGCRMYDASIGRFLTTDPAESGDNWQAYCDGDPVGSMDPTGLDVGAPTGLGGWEDCIPIWGPGRDAIHEYQTGKWGWGIFHTLLAASDVFMVKSLVMAGAKAMGKVGFRAGAKILAEEGAKDGSKILLDRAGLVKTIGSSTRAATRSWAARRGLVEAGEILHHWGIAVNSKVGKLVPDFIKNQPWNYLKISDGSIKGLAARVAHEGLHGVGRAAMGPCERLWYGTPSTFKAFVFSTAGHGISHYGN